MKKEDRDFLRKSSESGLPVQASEVNGSDRTLSVVACKWLCSQAKALMSSASLRHRVPSLYLLKIGHGSPSRAYLRGFRKLEEKTVLLLLVLLLEHANRSFRLGWRQFCALTPVQAWNKLKR
ncbi:hypothetical protein OIU74_025831 [Salix koriyanagi]|uniref:Uncharacterized protein n=1 Tax=Salix koriyanagi TaxID=2511006 RepID=A0A9Q1A611_9ROSI|nr:hypothetical protein OIU74_025831 [Salix koriyanagi]